MQARINLAAYCCATYACTQSCEINVFKKFCHLCNKLDTKERVEGGGGREEGTSYN